MIKGSALPCSGDHQIAFGKCLSAEIGGEGAGDFESKRVAVEQPLAEQRRRQQRARLPWARDSSAPLARDHVAPRPPRTIGRSASATIATISSITAGSGRSTWARGIRSVDGV